MKRTFVRLTACFALTAFVLAATNAHAGDHGKRRSNFSQSGGNGGGGNGSGGNAGGSGPSMKSMKLHSNMSSNLSSLNANGGNSGGNGNGGNSSFNPSFARKMNKSFAANQGNGSLPNGISSNKNLKFSRHGNSQLNNQFADAVKQGKFRPIDANNGNGNGGIVPGGIGNGNSDNKHGKFSNGKFKGWNPEKFADAINGNGQFPNGDDKFSDNKFDDIKFGNKKLDFNSQFGNGKNFGLNYGQFCDTPNQNKNCHNGFPWWKLWTNCYPNNCYPNNCYPNNWNCHYPNNYCPPIYYNYPPVTNVTVVNPQPQILAQPALPAQPTLVDGTDLELVDLRLVDIGDTAKGLGPRYRITFRNRGTLPAGNFQVMLLASTDGTPQPGSPSGVAEVAGAPSAQLLTVDVRLTPTPDLATMNHLIVALDTATQVVETEESNNVAVIDRAKVLMADLAVR